MAGRYSHDRTTSPRMRRCSKRRSIFRAIRTIKIIKDAVHEVKALLNLAHVPLTTEFTVEYSHHYGVQNFRKFGAVLINVINREYCKKVLVQLAGPDASVALPQAQGRNLPLAATGRLHVEVEVRLRVARARAIRCWYSRRLAPILDGDGLRIRGDLDQRISTNDSVYRDDAINKLHPAQRKTVVDHWGRFQISDQLREAEVPAVIRVVVFDFDGTLVDSNAIKREGFLRLAAGYPGGAATMAEVIETRAIAAPFCRRFQVAWLLRVSV